jgi:hypothetical protein
MKVIDDPGDGQTLAISQDTGGFELHRRSPRGASWDATFSKISQLQEGWNGYAAAAPTEKAILTAKGFLDVLLQENFEPTRLAPSAVGGVATTHRQGPKKVYVEFYNDGRVLALFSDDVSEPLIKRVDPSDTSFKSLIAEMRDYLDG